jgi:hypothetical protein
MPPKQPLTDICCVAGLPQTKRTHSKTRPEQHAGVIRAFPSYTRSILTKIYLCHACSCHEIEDGHAWTGKLPHQARHGLVQLHHLRGTLACVLRDSGALHRLAPTVRHMPGTGRRGHSLRRIYTYI